MNWFKKKSQKPEFEIPNYGILKLEMDRSDFYWFGDVNMPISENKIELTIEVVNECEPSDEQINRVKDFENNWKTLHDKLFDYITDRFRGSKCEKDKEDLEQMYYLLAIDLKRDDSEWYVVLEPHFHVPTIFNFFLRFTLKNNEIIWSNLQ